MNLRRILCATVVVLRRALSLIWGGGGVPAILEVSCRFTKRKYYVPVRGPKLAQKSHFISITGLHDFYTPVRKEVKIY
jgi:hypothetical protein